MTEHPYKTAINNSKLNPETDCVDKPCAAPNMCRLAGICGMSVKPRGLDDEVQYGLPKDGDK